jgi:hypothetical protein
MAVDLGSPTGEVSVSYIIGDRFDFTLSYLPDGLTAKDFTGYTVTWHIKDSAGNELAAIDAAVSSNGTDLEFSALPSEMPTIVGNCKMYVRWVGETEGDVQTILIGTFTVKRV